MAHGNRKHSSIKRLFIVDRDESVVYGQQGLQVLKQRGPCCMKQKLKVLFQRLVLQLHVEKKGKDAQAHLSLNKKVHLCSFKIFCLQLNTSQ